MVSRRRPGAERNGEPLDYDVAVVGCGPVGALAANLLGKAGLRTLVVERESEPHPLPRAIHLDHEMMRLFQSAGVIDRVAHDMRETDGNLHIGADHQMIRYLGTVGRPRPFGWANDYFFYQPELETHLREALDAYPQVELRLGTTFEGLEQDDTGVTITLASGTERSTARAGWVIACDGASSPVRKALGIPLDDLDFDEPWLVVDAEVDGPVRFPELTGVPPAANLQRLSVMMCDPARPTTVVPGRGNHRRWEFMLLPGEDEQEMVQPARVAELVQPWLSGIPHRIVRATTYRFHGLVAEQWQSGRVLLAGDAAHQTPPFFGQGMCHGFRDVANLAWKMALVATGSAPARILESYQPERELHVRRVISAAIDAGRYICILDPEAAATRDAAMLEKAREGQTQTAADLIPALTNGIVAAGTAAAGERFIQPILEVESGRVLLDDFTGGGWQLVARDAATADMARNWVKELRAPLSMTLVTASSVNDAGALAAWLDRHGASAAIVRPDFYVFGTAKNPERLRELLGNLSHALTGELA